MVRSSRTMQVEYSRNGGLSNGGAHSRTTCELFPDEKKQMRLNKKGQNIWWDKHVRCVVTEHGLSHETRWFCMDKKGKRMYIPDDGFTAAFERVTLSTFKLILAKENQREVVLSDGQKIKIPYVPQEVFEAQRRQRDKHGKRLKGRKAKETAEVGTKKDKKKQRKKRKKQNAAEQMSESDASEAGDDDMDVEDGGGDANGWDKLQRRRKEEQQDGRYDGVRAVVNARLVLEGDYVVACALSSMTEQVEEEEEGGSLTAVWEADLIRARSDHCARLGVAWYAWSWELAFSQKMRIVGDAFGYERVRALVGALREGVYGDDLYAYVNLLDAKVCEEWSVQTFAMLAIDIDAGPFEKRATETAAWDGMARVGFIDGMQTAYHVFFGAVGSCWPPEADVSRYCGDAMRTVERGLTKHRCGGADQLGAHYETLRYERNHSMFIKLIFGDMENTDVYEVYRLFWYFGALGVFCATVYPLWCACE